MKMTKDLIITMAITGAMFDCVIILYVAVHHRAMTRDQPPLISISRGFF